MTTPRSYKEAKHWMGYLGFFPPDLQIQEGKFPQEAFWPWGKLQVHLDRYVASEASVKLIVVHGGGGYGRMLFASALAADAGVAEVVAPDLPGYGLTAAPDGYTHEDWVDCLGDLIIAERARDGRPVVLFGASMGGLVAYAAAAKTRQVAGIVTTCLIDPRKPEVRRAVARMPWLAPISGLLLRMLSFFVGGMRIPIKWVANMSAMSAQASLNELVASDPQGGANSVPIRFLSSYLNYQPPLEPEAFDVCPVLIVHPAADSWTPPALTNEFYGRLRVPKQWVTLENAGHFPVELPGLNQLRIALRTFLRELQPRPDLSKRGDPLDVTT